MHIKSGIRKVIGSFLPSLPSLPSIPRIPNNRVTVANPAHKYQAYAQRTPVDSWQRSDLGVAEYGGHGSFSGGGMASSCFSIDICPDLILAAIAVAAAGAAFIIYQAITVAGRRKKRDDHTDETTWIGSFFSLFLPQHLRLEDILNLGMQKDISLLGLGTCI